MDDDFNYISDTRTIEKLNKIRLLESDTVSLPIGRNGHWS